MIWYDMILGRQLQYLISMLKLLPLLLSYLGGSAWAWSQTPQVPYRLETWCSSAAETPTATSS